MKVTRLTEENRFIVNSRPIDKTDNSSGSTLTEDTTLNEGPLKNVFRNIQNKLDPKGAKNRAEHDAARELKKTQNRAEVVLSKDFDIKNKDAKFYIPGKREPLDWEEWRQRYGGSIETTDPRYAEWYNAIVTTPDGYFIRRGAEDMSGKLLKRVPGQNDTISSVYKWDPSVTTDSQKSVNSDEAETTPTQSNVSKKKIVINKNHLKQIQELTNTCGLKIVNSQGQSTDIDSMSISDIKSCVIQFGSKSVPLLRWIDFAQQNHLIESLVESFQTNDTSYNFLLGDEVVEGMMGNLDDKELDYQIRYLTRIAKKLGLSRVDDLVMYCDAEWVYDPSIFDTRFYTLPTTPTEFEINDICFIAAKEMNEVWLYFRNEQDGIDYLDFCNTHI